MSEKKWKINIIDIIAVVLILAVAVFLGVKLLGSDEGGSEMVNIRYTVLCEQRPTETYEAVQQYIPGTLMASGTLYTAQIVAVEASPTMVLSGDGTWVEDPDHVDLTFTVEGQVEKGSVLVASVGTQEIRIGKEIILKTEYIEFEKAIVTDVSYS